MYFSLSVVAALAAVLPLTSAQTWSDCDPLKKEDGCPEKPGLQEEWTSDFTKGAAAKAGWTETSNSISFDGANGGLFRIKALGEGPTIQSDKYIFFGYVEAKVRAAPGAGIVSSIVLQSDDLDEIDWEWIGNEGPKVQTNYFGKGNTTTYDRMRYGDVSNPQGEWHTYAIDWRPESIKWLVDGRLIRELPYQEAVGGKNFPQTPMNVRIGNWVGGTPCNNEGTIAWAGGLADISKGPFDMYVQSVKIVNYNPGTAYKYGDKTGNWQSIQVIGGNAPSQPSQKTPSSPGTDSGSGSGASGGESGGKSTPPSGGAPGGHPGGAPEGPYGGSPGKGSGSEHGKGSGNEGGKGLGGDYGKGSGGEGGKGSGGDYGKGSGGQQDCDKDGNPIGQGQGHGSSGGKGGSGLGHGSGGQAPPAAGSTTYSTSTATITSCPGGCAHSPPPAVGGGSGPSTFSVSVSRAIIPAPSPSKIATSAIASPVATKSGGSGARTTSASPVQFTGAAVRKASLEDDKGVMALLVGALLWAAAF